MASSEFELAPCLPSDVEDMIRVYSEAFKSDYLGSFTFPSTIDPEVRYKWLVARFVGSFKKPEVHNIKIVHKATKTLAAWGRFVYPSASPPPSSDFDPTEWPAGCNLTVCAQKFGRLYALRAQNVDYANDYLVSLLQTDPKYQRKGLGSMLLRFVLDKADAEHRKVHIEATPAGKPVYERLGFKHIDVVEIDLREFGGEEKGRNWVMVRDPIVS